MSDGNVALKSIFNHGEAASGLVGPDGTCRGENVNTNEGMARR